MQVMAQKLSDEELHRIGVLAERVILLSRDDLLVHLRFLDAALSKLSLQARPGLGTIASDGSTLYYDPVYVLKAYRQESALLPRTLLHSLFHSVFAHSFGYDKLDRETWDLAADIAVEAVILELGTTAATLDTDDALRGKVKVLREDAGHLGAERLYRYFRKNPPSPRLREEYARSFTRDLHHLWKSGERYELTEEDWQQISRRIRAELKSFSEEKGMGDVLAESLEDATRTRYDYAKILDRFTHTGEETHINEEEFDYVYYTYGLRTYGNLPLVEPLEYREQKKVREFVIAIDTSASCSGEIVKGFLRKTFSLLKSSESFFQRVNIHILQCDSEIRSDVRLTSMEEIDSVIGSLQLHGGGATDFRPVFTYVDELKEGGEFENLKGLIYFTDGFGIYPPSPPGYEAIFAFLNEDPTRSPVPPWAMKAVLPEDELLGEAAEPEAEEAEADEERREALIAEEKEGEEA